MKVHMNRWDKNEIKDEIVLFSVYGKEVRKKEMWSGGEMGCNGEWEGECDEYALIIWWICLDDTVRIDDMFYIDEADEAESMPELDEDPAERDWPEAEPPEGVLVVRDSSRLLQQGRHFPNSPAHFPATFLFTQ